MMRNMDHPKKKTHDATFRRDMGYRFSRILVSSPQASILVGIIIPKRAAEMIHKYVIHHNPVEGTVAKRNEHDLDMLDVLFPSDTFRRHSPDPAQKKAPFQSAFNCS